MNPETEAATNLGASAALTSPWWLPALKASSNFAGDLLPILGAVWLVVQIATKISDYLGRRP